MIKRILAVAFAGFIFSSTCYAKENAGAYILMESDTRQIIKSENENMRMPIASTTKIMTAIIAVENANSQELFTVSENAQNQEGSSIYLREGDRISVENLLYGLLLNSGNDTAVTLAEGICGSCEVFAELMNEKAREIGCKNTNFKNPSGLNEEGHYSTAYDMALITAYAQNIPVIAKIMATKRYNIEQNGSITYLKNHNKLLWQYKYCTGGKTGFTKLSGRCLATTAGKDGIRLVAVTLNCPDDWQQHRNLFDYGFENVKKLKVIEKGSIIATRKINGASVNLLAKEEVEIPKVSGKRLNITAKLHLKETKSEIAAGEFLGCADIFCNGCHITKVSLESGQAMHKTSFFDLDFLKRIFWVRH